MLKDGKNLEKEVLTMKGEPENPILLFLVVIPQVR